MRLAVASLGLAVLSGTLAAQQATPAAAGAPAAAARAAAPVERRFEDLALTLRFPATLALVEQPAPTEANVRAAWSGQLGASALSVRLVVIGPGFFGSAFEEPSQVMDVIRWSLTDPTGVGDSTFEFDELSLLPGLFGWAEYAALAVSAEPDGGVGTGTGIDTGTPAPRQALRLVGLLESVGYAVELFARPPLAAADAKLAREALTRCVAYDGPRRVAKWTDDEAKARWEKDAPDAVRGDLEILRSPHYIILTNSSGGKSFAKKMEECYAEIRKAFPFDEVEGRRLMPVFLFRTKDQYCDFFPKALNSTVEAGRRTGGIASRDLYATWYEAPGDPVHIHEATHQIFANRLGLGGAGSWFQEGVANYMSTKDNQRGDAARAVKKGRSMPLPEFMHVESLLFSSKADDKSGGDEAGDQYELAALLIEFVRESKFGKAKFQDFIHAVGVTPRGDVPAIEAAIQRVYGVDLAGFEQQFVAYCKKR